MSGKLPGWNFVAGEIAAIMDLETGYISPSKEFRMKNKLGSTEEKLRVI